MQTIKPKTGKCIDCPPDGPNKPLIAKRCQMHYWIYRRNVNAAAEKQKDAYVDKHARKKALDLWFTAQIRQLPACCENCDEPLYIFAPWAAKAFIAHILPKRNFESVMIHPDNRLFLCLTCHTNFDNWSEEKVIKMKVFAVALQRSMLFMHVVHESEYKSLPGWFIELLNNAAPDSKA